MKLFIAVGVLVALLGITEAASTAAEAVQACSLRNPSVTKEDVDTYFGGIVSDGKAVTTGNNVASYTTCLLIETGVLSLNGNVDEVALGDKWYPGQTTEVIDKVHAAAQTCSDVYSSVNEQDWDTATGDVIRKFEYVSGLTPNFHECLVGVYSQIINQLTSSQYPIASDE